MCLAHAVISFSKCQNKTEDCLSCPDFQKLSGNASTQSIYFLDREVFINHQKETIGFVHKSLWNAVFARENENYASSDSDRHGAVRSILKANRQHSLKLRRVNIDYQTLTKEHRCSTLCRALQTSTSNNTECPSKSL